jgi:hypothetical protein
MDWIATLQGIASRDPRYSGHINHIISQYDDGGYSSEFMGAAGHGSRSNRGKDLKNPRGTCDPHKQGVARPGDGTCYQVHGDYGSMSSGKNNSPQRAQYMREYRKNFYKSKAEGAKDGMPTRKTVPKPFGKSHTRTAYLQHEYLRLKEENAELRRIYARIKSGSFLAEELLSGGRGSGNRSPRTPGTRALKTERGGQGLYYERARATGSNRSRTKADVIQEWARRKNVLFTSGQDSKTPIHGTKYHTYRPYGQGNSVKNKKEYDKWYYENVVKPSRGRGKTQEQIIADLINRRKTLHKDRTKDEVARLSPRNKYYFLDYLEKLNKQVEEEVRD